MKKQIYIWLLIIAIVAPLCAIGGDYGFEKIPPLVKKFQYQMNGKWRPADSSVHVGAKDYTEVINLRPTDTGYETVEGFSAITTTAIETPVNVHHFYKEGESHVIAKVNDSGTYYLYDNFTAIPSEGDFNATEIYTVDDGLGSFANGPQGVMFYVDDGYDLIWSGDEMRVAAFLSSDYGDATNLQDHSIYIDSDNENTTVTIGDGGTGLRYIYVGSPIKITGVKFYISSANSASGTITGATWDGDSWASLTITDGTASGGVPLAQTGTISWANTFMSTTKIRYIKGSTLYWYRFDLNTFDADIYQVSCQNIVLQPICDVWNSAPRTCISFQASRSSAYEEWTFMVAEKDSSTDAAYAAKIGGLTSSDHLISVFDDRSMAIQFTMFENNVNDANATIADVQYWDGDSYESVAWFSDGTSDGTSSFSKSGVLSWTPPTASSEHPQDIFGVTGYAYKITLSGTLTDGTGHDGTSIDLATGITAPLEMTGFDLVGSYGDRVLLIEGNEMHFSQSGVPWVFNGVDASDNGLRSKTIGDDNNVVAMGSIFNKFGSNLIEAKILLKKNSTHILAGSQPDPKYSDPFLVKNVSDTIGCAAPMTVTSGSMIDSNGQMVNVAFWLDFSGPVEYTGAAPSKIKGIENYFNPANDECINYSYIDKSVAYTDTINNQLNLLIPSGSSATANNTWLVYDYEYKRWFEKDPGILSPVDWDSSGDHVIWDSSGDIVYWITDAYSENFPQVVAPVVDENGARYNYGITSEGYMFRLDNGQTWGASAPIYQRIKTGYFSPPMTDDFGFWSYSKLRGVRIISEAIEESEDVRVDLYKDGDISTQYITVDLDSGGIIAKNLKAQNNFNEIGEVYSLSFTAITSEDKWTPLAWGYVGEFRRED